MEDQSSNNNSIQQQTTTAVPCNVCGVPCKGLVYGAVACRTCKTFFRRYAEHGLDALKCHFNGHCEININTRHTCAYCRLAKCFAIGMQKELIRASLSATSKKQQKRKTIDDDDVQIISTIPPRSNQTALIPTLSLLQADRSTLTVDQWNLLSNLSHCYDDHAVLSIGEKYMFEQNKLPVKLRFKAASVMKLSEMTLDATQSLYKNNRDFLSLSVDDRLTLLHSTLVHTGTISTNFIFYRIQLTCYPTFYDALEMITSASIASIAKRFPPRINFEMIVMKLFLVILSFSTFRCTLSPNTTSTNLSNIEEVLRIQNTYIELTWRYLLYKYDHERAVKCFSDFIRCVFLMNEAVVQAQEHHWFTSTIDSIAQKTKESLFCSQ